MSSYIIKGFWDLDFIWTKTIFINYIYFNFLALLRFIVTILPILINVAFVTLLERKILGFAQFRLGPRKISYIGVLQPFRDAIKLFVKQLETNYNVNWKLFLFSPVLMLILSLNIWNMLPLNNSFNKWPIIIISILVVLRLGIYPLLLIGWCSNRKYATLGSIRGVAQTISYEIRLAILIIQFILFFIHYNVKEHILNGAIIRISLPCFTIIWLVLLLAETNRTPFDFSEGESELVSGFNIEYASTGFVLIFLSEYAIILLFSATSIRVFSSIPLFSITAALRTVLISGIWIVIRATLPRYRYDMLINIAWKTYLPLALGFVLLTRRLLIS